MTARDRRLLVALALLSCVCLLAEAAGALGLTLLYLAPLLLIGLPLLSGRYVGEGRIVRLATAYRARRRSRAPRIAAPSITRRAACAVPRGGRLIAASLAVRPPPAALASH